MGPAATETIKNHSISWDYQPINTLQSWGSDTQLWPSETYELIIPTLYRRDFVVRRFRVIRLIEVRLCKGRTSLSLILLDLAARGKEIAWPRIWIINEREYAYKSHIEIASRSTIRRRLAHRARHWGQTNLYLSNSNTHALWLKSKNWLWFQMKLQPTAPSDEDLEVAEHISRFLD